MVCPFLLTRPIIPLSVCWKNTVRRQTAWSGKVFSDVWVVWWNSWWTPRIFGQAGLKENTLVVFTCDNGWSTASSNTDDPNQKLFRSYAQRTKGSPYEGGTRNPILLSGLNRITPEDSSDLAHAIDLFPTIVSAAAESAKDYRDWFAGWKARKQRDTIFGVNHSTHNMTLAIQTIPCSISGALKEWKLFKRYQGRIYLRITVLFINGTLLLIICMISRKIRMNWTILRILCPRGWSTCLPKLSNGEKILGARTKIKLS